MASDAGSSSGKEQLLTREGETIRVEVTRTELAVVVVAPNDQLVARASIPYPRAGYGGHELVLSRHERYVAMFLYSGQSEIGCELFSLRPELRHVRSWPYELGEGLGPSFCADERFIALAWATNSRLDLTTLPELEDEAETPNEVVVDWAKLRVEPLPNGGAESCMLQVRLPPGFPVERDDAYSPHDLEFIGANELQFKTGWGELVRLSLPLPSSVIIPGPP